MDKIVADAYIDLTLRLKPAKNALNQIRNSINNNLGNAGDQSATLFNQRFARMLAYGMHNPSLLIFSAIALFAKQIREKLLTALKPIEYTPIKKIDLHNVMKDIWGNADKYLNNHVVKAGKLLKELGHVELGRKTINANSRFFTSNFFKSLTKLKLGLKTLGIRLKNIGIGIKNLGIGFRKLFKNGGIRALNFAKKLISVKGALIAIAVVIGGFFVAQFGKFIEELNKTEMLFRKFAYKAENFIDRIKTSFGLSDIEVRKNVNDIQNALAPFFGRKEATKLTLETVVDEKGNALGSLAQRALDIASMRNLELNDVIRLFTSSLIRGGRAAQSLGSSMSQSEVNSRAMLKFNVKNEKQLTVMQKIWARAVLIMERTVDSQGDLLRTTTSIKNAWRGLIGTFKNVAIYIGGMIDMFDVGGMLTAIRSLIQLIGTLAMAGAKAGQSIKPLFSLAWGGVTYLISSMTIYFNKFFNWLSEKYGMFGRWMKKKFGAAFDGFDFTLFNTKEIEKQYNYALKVREKLVQKQSKNKKVDPALSAEIFNLEAKIRIYRSLLEMNGVKFDVVEPFKNVNEEIEKTAKLMASISNDIKSVIRDAQKLAIETTKWAENSKGTINKNVIDPIIKPVSNKVLDSGRKMRVEFVDKIPIVDRVMHELDKAIYKPVDVSNFSKNISNKDLSKPSSMSLFLNDVVKTLLLSSEDLKVTMPKPSSTINAKDSQKNLSSIDDKMSKLIDNTRGSNRLFA